MFALFFGRDMKNWAVVLGSFVLSIFSINVIAAGGAAMHLAVSGTSVSKLYIHWDKRYPSGSSYATGVSKLLGASYNGSIVSWNESLNTGGAGVAAIEIGRGAGAGYWHLFEIQQRPADHPHIAGSSYPGSFNDNRDKVIDLCLDSPSNGEPRNSSWRCKVKEEFLSNNVLPKVTVYGEVKSLDENNAEKWERASMYVDNRSTDFLPVTYATKRDGMRVYMRGEGLGFYLDPLDEDSYDELNVARPVCLGCTFASAFFAVDARGLDDSGADVRVSIADHGSYEGVYLFQMIPLRDVQGRTEFWKREVFLSHLMPPQGYKYGPYYNYSDAATGSTDSAAVESAISAFTSSVVGLKQAVDALGASYNSGTGGGSGVSSSTVVDISSIASALSSMSVTMKDVKTDIDSTKTALETVSSDVGEIRDFLEKEAETPTAPDVSDSTSSLKNLVTGGSDSPLFSVLDPYRKFAIGAQVQCVRPKFELHGVEFFMDGHCKPYEDYIWQIRQGAILVWMIMAVFIVLRA